MESSGGKTDGFIVGGELDQVWKVGGEVDFFLTRFMNVRLSILIDCKDFCQCLVGHPKNSACEAAVWKNRHRCKVENEWVTERDSITCDICEVLHKITK